MRNLGGRPKKVKVALTEESVTDIMSKVYAESDDLRTKALSFYSKSIKDTRENTSVALVGKTAAEYLKIANVATQTKLQIGKIIIDHITKTSGITDDPENVDGQKQLTNDMKENFKNMMEKISKGGEKLKIEPKKDSENE